MWPQIRWREQAILKQGSKAEYGGGDGDGDRVRAFLLPESFWDAVSVEGRADEGTCVGSWYC